MIIKNMLVSDAEDKMFELECSLKEFEIQSCSEISKIIVDGSFIYIKELGVNIHSALCCNYDEAEQEYVPDHSLYIFFDAIKNDLIYDEGVTCLEAAISNFSGFDMEYIHHELNCDIHI